MTPELNRISTRKPRVLVIEDQEPMRKLLDEFLVRHGFEAQTFGSVSEVLGAAGESPDLLMQLMEQSDPADNRALTNYLSNFDVILTDIKMPGITGLEFCQVLHAIMPRLPVVVMTAYGSLETAVESLRSGAFDFVTKPVELEVLKASLLRAAESSLLRREVAALQSQISSSQFPTIIGESEAIQKVKQQLSRFIESDAAILLTGESGVGKEVVARSVHAQSSRSEKPFIAVNCAALPESLIESELFGHVKGAFTDAKSDRKGLFLEADGGTLFLDEIGELPLEMQPKLLRAIEQSTVRPVGGKGSDSERSFDVRLITATNRDLTEEVEQRRFREDLFYRINVLEIQIPPLRRRGLDVLILAQHFLDELHHKNGGGPQKLDDLVAQKMLAYDWPGNVRELRNVVERAVALANSEVIGLDSLPDKIVNHQPDQLVLGDRDYQPLATLGEIESRYIQYVLEHTGGNRSEAARILGVDRKTLYRKLKEEQSLDSVN